MLEDLTLKIVAGLIGAAILYLIQRTYAWIVEERSPYTGQWIALIKDSAGNVKKEDRWDLRQRGDTLSGTSSRSKPPEQNHRKWKLEGRLRGHDFLGTFLATTQDIPSYGVWHVKQTRDDQFDGFYLSLQRSLAESTNTVTESLEPVRLTLRRDRLARG